MNIKFIYIILSTFITMDVLLKNRYFRRECFAKTWAPYKAYINGEHWYFHYIVSYSNTKLLYKACLCRDIDVIKKASKSALHYKNGEYMRQCASRCYIEGVDWFVSQGVDINSSSASRQGKQWNVLSIGCYFGFYDIIKYALEHGADIHYNEDQAIIECCRTGLYSLYTIHSDDGEVNTYEFMNIVLSYATHVLSPSTLNVMIKHEHYDFFMCALQSNLANINDLSKDYQEKLYDYLWRKK